MVAIRIPGTNQIIFKKEHIGDTVIDLKNYPEIGDTIKNEDIMVTGNWSDYSGSGTKSPSEVMLQGISDKNPSSVLAQIGGEGTKLTNRGKKARTHRQRTRLVTI